MAKLVGPGRGCIDPGTQEGMANNRSDRTLSQKAAKGSSGAQEYSTTGGARSSMAQIGHNRLADILGQGKLGPVTAFSVNAQSSTFPVDVVEFQESDLS